MSTGMISSLNRQIPSHDNRTMRTLIQIDASINQGNSGGPLLSTSGKLIGMNTAIMSSSGDSTGVGFAIAANTLERVVPQLISNGRVIRPSIGITRVYETEKGLLVVSLAPGGAAEQAGLQGFQLIMTKRVQGAYTYEIPRIDASQADLIKAVDGQPVATADELLALIEMKKPNETVELSIVRQAKEMTVKVKLGTRTRLRTCGGVHAQLILSTRAYAAFRSTKVAFRSAKVSRLLVYRTFRGAKGDFALLCFTLLYFRGAKGDVGDFAMNEPLGECFDPKAPWSISEHCRPHWSQAGAVIFITFRTADSIPREVLQLWEREKNDWITKITGIEQPWREALPTLSADLQNRFRKQFHRKREDFLDDCCGACVLRRPELAKIVANSLLHFDGERYRMGDFIVMPNHVHLLASFSTEAILVAQCDSWLHLHGSRNQSNNWPNWKILAARTLRSPRAKPGTVRISERLHPG